MSKTRLSPSPSDQHYTNNDDMYETTTFGRPSENDDEDLSKVKINSNDLSSIQAILNAPGGRRKKSGLLKSEAVKKNMAVDGTGFAPISTEDDKLGKIATAYNAFVGLNAAIDNYNRDSSKEIIGGKEVDPFDNVKGGYKAAIDAFNAIDGFEEIDITQLGAEDAIKQAAAYLKEAIKGLKKSEVAEMKNRRIKENEDITATASNQVPASDEEPAYAEPADAIVTIKDDELTNLLQKFQGGIQGDYAVPQDGLKILSLTGKEIRFEGDKYTVNFSKEDEGKMTLFSASKGDIDIDLTNGDVTYGKNQFPDGIVNVIAALNTYLGEVTKPVAAAPHPQEETNYDMPNVSSAVSHDDRNAIDEFAAGLIQWAHVQSGEYEYDFKITLKDSVLVKNFQHGNADYSAALNEGKIEISHSGKKILSINSPNPGHDAKTDEKKCRIEINDKSISIGDAHAIAASFARLQQQKLSTSMGALHVVQQSLSDSLTRAEILASGATNQEIARQFIASCTADKIEGKDAILKELAKRFGEISIDGAKVASVTQLVSTSLGSIEVSISHEIGSSQLPEGFADQFNFHGDVGRISQNHIEGDYGILATLRQLEIIGLSDKEKAKFERKFQAQATDLMLKLYESSSQYELLNDFSPVEYMLEMFKANYKDGSSNDLSGQLTQKLRELYYNHITNAINDLNLGDTTTAAGLNDTANRAAVAAYMNYVTSAHPASAKRDHAEPMIEFRRLVNKFNNEIAKSDDGRESPDLDSSTDKVAEIVASIVDSATPGESTGFMTKFNNNVAKYDLSGIDISAQRTAKVNAKLTEIYQSEFPSSDSSLAEEGDINGYISSLPKFYTDISKSREVAIAQVTYDIAKFQESNPSLTEDIIGVIRDQITSHYNRMGHASRAAAQPLPKAYNYTAPDKKQIKKFVEGFFKDYRRSKSIRPAHVSSFVDSFMNSYVQGYEKVKKIPKDQQISVNGSIQTFESFCNDIVVDFYKRNILGIKPGNSTNQEQVKLIHALNEALGSLYAREATPLPPIPKTTRQKIDNLVGMHAAGPRSGVRTIDGAIATTEERGKNLQEKLREIFLVQYGTKTPHEGVTIQNDERNLPFVNLPDGYKIQYNPNQSPSSFYLSDQAGEMQGNLLLQSASFINKMHGRFESKIHQHSTGPDYLDRKEDELKAEYESTSKTNARTARAESISSDSSGDGVTPPPVAPRDTTNDDQEGYYVEPNPNPINRRTTPELITNDEEDQVHEKMDDDYYVEFPGVGDGTPAPPTYQQLTRLTTVLAGIRAKIAPDQQHLDVTIKGQQFKVTNRKYVNFKGQQHEVSGIESPNGVNKLYFNKNFERATTGDLDLVGLIFRNIDAVCQELEDQSKRFNLRVVVPPPPPAVETVSTPKPDDESLTLSDDVCQYLKTSIDSIIKTLQYSNKLVTANPKKLNKIEIYGCKYEINITRPDETTIGGHKVNTLGQPNHYFLFVKADENNRSMPEHAVAYLDNDKKQMMFSSNADFSITFVKKDGTQLNRIDGNLDTDIADKFKKSITEDLKSEDSIVKSTVKELSSYQESIIKKLAEKLQQYIDLKTTIETQLMSLGLGIFNNFPNAVNINDKLDKAIEQNPHLANIKESANNIVKLVNSVYVRHEDSSIEKRLQTIDLNIQQFNKSLLVYLNDKKFDFKNSEIEGEKPWKKDVVDPIESAKYLVTAFTQKYKEEERSRGVVHLTPTPPSEDSRPPHPKNLIQPIIDYINEVPTDPTKEGHESIDHFKTTLDLNKSNPKPVAPYRGVGIKVAVDAEKEGLRIDEVADPGNGRFTGLGDLDITGGHIMQLMYDNGDGVKLTPVLEIFEQEDKAGRDPCATIASILHSNDKVEFVVEKDSQTYNVSCDNGRAKTGIYTAKSDGKLDSLSNMLSHQETSQEAEILIENSYKIGRGINKVLIKTPSSSTLITSSESVDIGASPTPHEEQVDGKSLKLAGTALDL